MGGGTAETVKTVATGGLSDVRRKGKKALEIPDFSSAAMAGKEADIPGRESEEVQRAAMKERQRLRMQRGRRSTILTSLRQAAGGAGQTLG